MEAMHKLDLDSRIVEDLDDQEKDVVAFVVVVDVPCMDFVALVFL
jgi:hypothetical protein